MIVGICVYVELFLPQHEGLLKMYNFLTNVIFSNNNPTFSLAPYQSLQNAFSLNILFLSSLKASSEFDHILLILWSGN